MRRAFCIAVCAALGASLVAASDAVPLAHLPTVEAKPVLGQFGPVSVDFETGRVVPGSGMRGTPVYDNTDPSSDQLVGLGATLLDPFGDDMVLVPGGGLLEEYGFSIFNGSGAGNLNSCTVTITFYDYDYFPLGQFAVNLNMTTLFGAPIPPGFSGLVNLTNLAGQNVNLPRFVTSEIAFSNVVGGATDVAQVTYYPSQVGWSSSVFQTFGLWVVYNGQLYPADFYQRVVVTPASSNELLWTTGGPYPVFFNNANTLLGYISGNAGAGVTERWAAIPFALSQDSTIEQMTAYWFDDGVAVPPDIRYTIWKRTGLAAPVNGDQVATGTFPYDFGNGPGEYFHAYNLNLPLSAGSYYLQLHGEGAAPPVWLAWLTGGDKQAESVEQDFMWRSATFPSPGFVAYNPGTIGVGPQMTDQEDRWNCTFALWGTTGAAPCPEDCTGDGQIDQADLAQLLGCYNTGPCCDITGDGITDQADLAALLGVYNTSCP